MDKFIGKRLDGRYEISELIGVGGMAVVYKAYDNIDDRIVAVKILKEEFLANDEFRRRFKNESKAIAVLSHPNIVKVYDVSFGDILQYIVMEYINGITLKKYIEQQGVIEWKEAIHFTSQILKALEHAHEKGIVHRDIKPQNIMLLPDGTIKVTDFGIARFSRSEQRTITNKAIGSVHYISPEQARGDFTDGRADIYSVGVMLYEMTTGQVPFQADSAVSVAIMQLQNNPVSPGELNPMIPLGLEEITLKAMKKDAENRFASAADMLADLETVYNDPTAVFDYRFAEISTHLPEKADYERKPAKSSRSDDDQKSNVIPILSGIAIVFVIGLIIAGIFIFKSLNAVSGASFDCPDLVGKKYDDIIKSDLYSKYHIIRSDESTYNADYEEGYIYRQSPEKGVKIKDASEITVYVSLGGRKMTLLDYANRPLDSVTKELDELGLKYIVKNVANEDIKSGNIITTSPVPGSVVSVGKEITLYVSTGEEQILDTVPSVVNMKSEDAQKMIEEKGYRVGSVSTSSSDSIAEGYVISQSPDQNTSAALGSSISIVVSSGRETTAAVHEITINIPLPTADKSVIMAFSLDGSTVGSENVNLRSGGEKKITVSGSGNGHEIVIKLDGTQYAKYDVDFTSGKWTQTFIDPDVMRTE